MSCPDTAVWVDYFAGDLPPDEEAALEAHLFACDRCTEAAAGPARVIADLRALIPPVVGSDALAELRARGLRIEEQTLTPDRVYDVVFPRHADLLIFRLTGLDLSGASRVAFRMLAEDTGETLLAAVDPAPFDRDAGAVLVACQRHYAELPANTVAEVRVVDASGRETVGRYTIHHHFAG